MTKHDDAINQSLLHESIHTDKLVFVPDKHRHSNVGSEYLNASFLKLFSTDSIVYSTIVCLLLRSIHIIQNYLCGCQR